MIEDRANNSENGNVNNKVRITFDSKNVSHPIYENDAELKTSYFKEVYAEADSIVERIIYKSEDIITSRDNKESSERRLINNVVPFIGERGVGKTSAMISFGNHLKDKPWEADRIYGDKVAGLGYESTKFVFTVLDVFDPTYMDNNESLFEVVVARMFSLFEDDCRERNKQRDKAEQNKMERSKVQKAFENTYTAIKTRHNYESARDEADEGDTIAFLRKLSRSSTLRSTFSELLTLFLDFHNKECRDRYRRNYLVILIDDMDMRQDKLFDFSEEIRKYLMMPNIIILTAFKYDQYKTGITNHYLEVDKRIELYSHLFSETQEHNFAVLENKTEKIAMEYLEKLFPSDQRANLMNISHKEDYETETEIEIKYIDPRGKRKDSESLKVVKSFFQYLAWLVFEKTGIRLAFMDRSHPFMPANLREYQVLVDMLMQLKDYNEKDETNEKNNLLWFKNYIIGNWAYDNLSYAEVQFLRKISHANCKNVNHIICKYLRDCLEKERIFHENGTRKFQEITPLLLRLEERIRERSETLGLVMNILFAYGNINESKHKFLFAVRIIYTCILKSIDKKDLKDLINPLKTDELEKDVYPEFVESSHLNILPQLYSSHLFSEVVIGERKEKKNREYEVGRIEQIKDAYEEPMKAFIEKIKALDIDKSSLKTAKMPEDLKESLRYLELSSFFLKKVGITSTFDILYILYSENNYLEICNNLYEELGELYEEPGNSPAHSKEDIINFINNNGLREELKSKDNSSCKTLFPIDDLDFTNGILRELSYAKETIDFNNANKISTAYKQLFKKIAMYIKVQNEKINVKDSNSPETDLKRWIESLKCSPILQEIFRRAVSTADPEPFFAFLADVERRSVIKSDNNLQLVLENEQITVQSDKTGDITK